MDLPEFAIEARGVVKTYPATKTSPEMKALRGVDLAVPELFFVRPALSLIHI